MSSLNIFNESDSRFTSTGTTYANIAWIDGQAKQITNKSLSTIKIGGKNTEFKAIASSSFKNNIVSVKPLLDKGYTYVVNKDGSFLTKDTVKMIKTATTELMDINNNYVKVGKVQQITRQNSNQNNHIRTEKLFTIKTIMSSNVKQLQLKSTEWLQQCLQNDYWKFHATQGHYKTKIDDQYFKKFGKKPTQEDILAVKHCPICSVRKFKHKTTKVKQHLQNAKQIGDSLHIDMMDITIQPICH